MEESRNLQQDRAIKDGYRHYLSDYTDIANRIKARKDEEPANIAEAYRFALTGQICAYQAAALYDRRWQAACEVLDIVAAQIGVSSNDKGYTDTGRGYYGIDWDYSTKTASSVLADKISDYFDRSGDKVKLKKQISELEKENELLRKMLRDGK